MLSAIRDKVAALKTGGASEQEAIAKKPTVDFDPVWSKGFFVNGDVFTGLCTGLYRRHPRVSRYAEPMARLIEELKKLPGSGDKDRPAVRLPHPALDDEDAAALAEAVRGLKASLRLCSICNNITDVDPCAYCASPTRNQRLVCVVEEPTNIEAVERTRGYNGVYHVLHGTLSPLHGVGRINCAQSTLVAARRARRSG